MVDVVAGMLFYIQKKHSLNGSYMYYAFKGQGRKDLFIICGTQQRWAPKDVRKTRDERYFFLICYEHSTIFHIRQTHCCSLPNLFSCQKCMTYLVTTDMEISFHVSTDVLPFCRHNALAGIIWHKNCVLVLNLFLLTI